MVSNRNLQTSRGPLFSGDMLVSGRVPTTRVQGYGCVLLHWSQSATRHLHLRVDGRWRPQPEQTTNKNNKQPNNQTTKQPNNKQPNNQTTNNQTTKQRTTTQHTTNRQQTTNNARPSPFVATTKLTIHCNLQQKRCVEWEFPIAPSVSWVELFFRGIIDFYYEDINHILFSKNLKNSPLFSDLWVIQPIFIRAPRLASAFARARLMLKRCKSQTAKMPSISKNPVEYNHPRCYCHYFSKVIGDSKVCVGCLIHRKRCRFSCIRSRAIDIYIYTDTHMCNNGVYIHINLQCPSTQYSNSQGDSGTWSFPLVVDQMAKVTYATISCSIEAFQND